MSWERAYSLPLDLKNLVSPWPAKEIHVICIQHICGQKGGRRERKTERDGEGDGEK